MNDSTNPKNLRLSLLIAIMRACGDPRLALSKANYLLGKREKIKAAAGQAESQQDLELGNNLKREMTRFVLAGNESGVIVYSPFDKNELDLPGNPLSIIDGQHQLSIGRQVIFLIISDELPETIVDDTADAVGFGMGCDRAKAMFRSEQTSWTNVLQEMG